MTSSSPKSTMSSSDSNRELEACKAELDAVKNDLRQRNFELTRTTSQLQEERNRLLGENKQLIQQLELTREDLINQSKQLRILREELGRVALHDLQLRNQELERLYLELMNKDHQMRVALSTQLHNDIVSSLKRVHAFLQQLKEKGIEAHNVKGKAETFEREQSETVNYLRTKMEDLYPRDLLGGLIYALDLLTIKAKLAITPERRQNQQVELHVGHNDSNSREEIEAAIKTIGEAQVEYVYCIVKLAVDNAIEHAKDFTKIELSLQRRKDALIVTVADNGRGKFPGPRPRREGSTGVLDMENKARALGAKLYFVDRSLEEPNSTGMAVRLVVNLPNQDRS